MQLGCVRYCTALWREASTRAGECTPLDKPCTTNATDCPLACLHEKVLSGPHALWTGCFNAARTDRLSGAAVRAIWAARAGRAAGRRRVESA